jgi:heterodisulfide reductase subunit A2
MSDKVLIIGGGISGLRTAIALSRMNINSLIIEKDSVLGGKVKEYSKVFPDFRNGKSLVGELINEIEKSDRISVHTDCTVSELHREGKAFNARLGTGEIITAGAVVLACGFDLFNPKKQMEYGYGVYKNVISSIELERMLSPSGPTGGELIRPHDNNPARRIALIFCVGSRNVKIGNPYCSRVCCSYSTKQAIEIKELYPDANVVCFYMDIRTYGRGFEEMYQTAQQLGVKYIRGRVSECSMLTNGDIQIRAENTLMKKPVQGIFDLVSLSLGMMPCEDAAALASMTGIKKGVDGFFISSDEYLNPYDSTVEGVFLAGSITGLKPIKDCLQDGDGVAGRIMQYMRRAG